MTSEGGRFADLMAKQAETVQGKFSNLQDGFELLRREIGAALLPIVAEFADVLLDEVLPAVEPLIPLIGELLSKSLRNVVDVVEPMIPLMIDLIREFLDLGLVMLNDVVPVVQDQLFPAIKNELVPALRDDLLPALLKLIPTMTDFFVDTIIPNLPVLIRFTALILKAVSAILELIDVLVDLFTQVKKFAGLEKKGLLSFLDFTPIGFLTKKVTGVDDFILRPDGSLLKTNPNDTIIGTQNPGGLGGSIVVNIENINGISGRDIADALEEELTNRVSLS